MLAARCALTAWRCSARPCAGYSLEAARIFSSLLPSDSVTLDSFASALYWVSHRARAPHPRGTLVAHGIGVPRLHRGHGPRAAGHGHTRTHRGRRACAPGSRHREPLPRTRTSPRPAARPLTEHDPAARAGGWVGVWVGWDGWQVGLNFATLCRLGGCGEWTAQQVRPLVGGRRGL